MGQAKLTVAQAGIDQHVVAAAVGHDQVGDAVAVEVGQRHGAGRQQALGAVAEDGRGAAASVLDGHPVQGLVGVDDVLLSVPLRSATASAICWSTVR